MAIDRMRMADKHEAFIADLLAGRRSKASGSTWNDKGDGRGDHTEEPFAFAWDCKATLAKSHTVTREMLAKLREEAGGERPLLPLRWYDDESLRSYEDWALLRADDLAELRDAATQAVLAAEHARELEQQVAVLEAELTGQMHRAARAEQDLKDAVQAGRRRELEQRETPRQPGPEDKLAGLIPKLPWTCVFVTNVEGMIRHNGVRYDAEGHATFFEIDSVRVEPYGQGKRLFVNEQIVRHGDLWIDGRLDTRTGA